MSNKPTLIAYAVKDRGDDKKSVWTRIGAAWPHQSGKGFTIELEAMPVNGRLVLTEPKPEAQTAEEAGLPPPAKGKVYVTRDVHHEAPAGEGV